ncbi:endoglucanase E-4-like [Amphiura filiformis]|uniref:endoglucanase E-4-like n=1 Tax=Amphiura filiformis TaxID=82378 RepID=UPI003B218591
MSSWQVPFFEGTWTMKGFWLFELLLLNISVSLCMAEGAHPLDIWCTCGSTTWISGEWTGNIEANFQIPVSTALNGWTLQLRFNQPVTQIQLYKVPYDYGEVLKKSTRFYEAQRSGDLPNDNRIDWRGDSALNDGSDVGVDLTGGWYDAGDFVKFGFPMAQSATILAWGLIEYQAAYEATCQLDIMRDSLRWVTDYFLKAHTAPNEFYAQVGDGVLDHNYWGRPEEMTMPRPSFKLTTSKPGSDVVGETAAALAAASIAFKSSDASYSALLLSHAKELYTFADTYRGKYSVSIPEAAEYYSSTAYGDELAWAASWIYFASNEASYLTAAENHYNSFNLHNVAWAFSWDDKEAGVQLLLYKLTSKSTYGNIIQQFLDSWSPTGSVPYTPKGLAYRDKWGATRYAANSAFLALVAADAGLKPSVNRGFSESQINYMLGDGGQSFVVGFGKNPPNAPHHSSSSCPDLPAPCGWNEFSAPGPNPQILNGALVGGPDEFDNFVNDRTDYIYNEVTCDYNAGFQSAVAGLYTLYM